MSRANEVIQRLLSAEAGRKRIQALEVLSIDAQIRAVRLEDQRRRGKAQAGHHVRRPGQ